MVKFLIVRFSSIGDIVLTTPVIRAIKQQVENAEVHYITKAQFSTILENNPYVDKLHLLKEDINETIDDLLLEDFDYIIDLHKNLRTNRIKNKLPVVAFSFDKLNFKKWLLVNFKIDRMPDLHIVSRYLDTATWFDVEEDGQGLDYFIPEKDEVEPKQLHAAFEGKYMAVVLGANHATKQIPADKITAIINTSGVPVCLLGGADVSQQAIEIEQKLKVPFLNTVGKLSLNQSASLVKQSTLVLTPDTGLMHIAAAFKKPILSLWGNTVPAFGMTPYLPHEQSRIFEVNYLRCRPCSKLGFKKCPKGHFKCMHEIDNAAIVNQITEIIK